MPALKEDGHSTITELAQLVAEAVGFQGQAALRQPQA